MLLSIYLAIGLPIFILISERFTLTSIYKLSPKASQGVFTLMFTAILGVTLLEKSHLVLDVLLSIMNLNYEQLRRTEKK